jgi:hypothetical protein
LLLFWLSIIYMAYLSPSPFLLNVRSTSICLPRHYEPFRKPPRVTCWPCG